MRKTADLQSCSMLNQNSNALMLSCTFYLHDYVLRRRQHVISDMLHVLQVFMHSSALCCVTAEAVDPGCLSSLLAFPLVTSVHHLSQSDDHARMSLYESYLLCCVIVVMALQELSVTTLYQNGCVWCCSLRCCFLWYTKRPIRDAGENNRLRWRLLAIKLVSVNTCATLHCCCNRYVP